MGNSRLFAWKQLKETASQEEENKIYHKLFSFPYLPHWLRLNDRRVSSPKSSTRFLILVGFAVGTEMVMVDEIPFPPQITTAKPLCLLGYGKPLPYFP
ncbi:hypothetical protein CK203_070831 [Vitis vinifera]|uniref:Uncharacterized protein n=1 Tax=Vitis vinifera TaxID=29760 RepID=A0A438E3T0_VITVI|nr:hypothetical protein CK203_070831 [Vitis vinifera]